MDRFEFVVRHSESDTVWDVIDNLDRDDCIVEEFSLSKGYTIEQVRAFVDGMNRVCEWLGIVQDEQGE